jgi:ABC-type phosphate transport system auxiliary subunit
MEFLLSEWYKITGLLIGAATFLVSPVVVLRWLRTRNELVEMETFVKKNEVVRNEIAAINEEISRLTAQLREVEMQLHQERIINQELRAENKRLKQINEQLRSKLDEVDDWEL